MNKINCKIKRYLLLLMLYATPVGLSGQSGILTVHSDGLTALMAKDAVLQEGLKPYRIEPAKAFWVENRTDSNRLFTWKLSVARRGLYKVNLLLNMPGERPDEDRRISVELAVNGKKTVREIVAFPYWERHSLEQTVELAGGDNTLSLGLAPVSGTGHTLQLYSVELIRPQVERQMEKRAARLQRRPQWFSDAGYGFFFHWNSKSMPRRGDAGSYTEAVDAFDVAAFAETVHDCGADFIIFTTTWAEYYFPAPLQSIDKILPGRTARRDLIYDLSTELSKYGIKLMLYYHLGHGDPEWWDRQGFRSPDAGNLFTNLQEITGEISLRYKDRVAGLFLDDGMIYYPHNAPFEDITKAAKKGNRDMVVSYNCWIFPQLTLFQDYYTGENGISMETAKAWDWAIDNAGYFTSGPQTGLRATFCGLLEPGDWAHLPKDTDIPPPLFTSEQLTEIVRTAMARRNVPVMNVSVYRDGSISPETFRLLKELNHAVHAKRHSPVLDSTNAAQSGLR
ncbi:MAG: alpha-L-fucosidase [Tannerella sp.]|jgi:hypothetical protein|nr:alpha-L-fucosidase [Tannerella sp.]